MNNRLYGNLVFELSKKGRKGYSLPKNTYEKYSVADLPAGLKRELKFADETAGDFREFRPDGVPGAESGAQYCAFEAGKCILRMESEEDGFGVFREGCGERPQGIVVLFVEQRERDAEAGGESGGGAAADAASGDERHAAGFIGHKLFSFIRTGSRLYHVCRSSSWSLKMVSRSSCSRFRYSMSRARRSRTASTAPRLPRRS